MSKKERAGHLVDAEKLKEFADQYSTSAQDVADTASEHANLMQRIGDAGVNKQAFKLVMKLMKMDLLKAQDFARSFQTYAKVLGLSDRLASQPDMLVDEEAREEAAPAAATKH